SATLTGPGGASLSGSSSDYVVGLGDLYPAASLKWNRDVHNFMVYATTGVPVGVYDPTRLASMGLGHWAADAGAGYTYLNEQVGFEWSAVVGFTYNFINPYTQFRIVIDAHLDWAISPYLTDKLHIGAVGYVYNQVTGDSGASPVLGGFRSRVAGIGPQIGFFFPIGEREGYLNLRGYSEFDAKNRLEGWTAYVTFSVEAAEQKSAQPRLARPTTLPRCYRSFVGRESLQPPRAIATPTNARPTATVERPVAHGRNPAQRPSAYPHTNSIPMATALERRSANRASPMKMNGMTIGNVDRKLSK